MPLARLQRGVLNNVHCKGWAQFAEKGGETEKVIWHNLAT